MISVALLCYTLYVVRSILSVINKNFCRILPVVSLVPFRESNVGGSEIFLSGGPPCLLCNRYGVFPGAKEAGSNH